MKRIFLIMLTLSIPLLVFAQQTRENERAAQIYGLGVLVGIAENAALEDAKPSYVAEKLQFAIYSANMIGCVSSDPIWELREKMLTATSSNELYGEIEAYRRDVLYLEILENCACAIDFGCCTAANIEGTWDSNFGELNLQVSQNQVWGTYDYNGGGRIEGTLECNELKGTYRQDNASGEFTLTFNESCNSFTARYWDPASKQYLTDWSGKKVDHPGF
ncbi:MAG: hypothetical protein HKN53_11370 [Maribacter sp.]|nr:hypothetical protein [Maribacter sp.]